ncbi:DnaA regulatory inactivator Hda [Parahaliea maris]|uniref:DnaA regulatory inactivator Hda n=1 Tax=Parahaliea maris TaxID=2716870 RepID=A0A5C8ZUH9_9GAMM|nr:DnaA regulatory inactivator Hda [Parahaliea maris]TXS92163.1 DnaA regulatory inactivator Hda [Parahaliea maris]
MTATSGGHQLALNVQLRDDATLDNFYVTEPLFPLLPLLQLQREEGGEPVLYLYGSPGCGKSHLLQASCHLASEGALYLPLGELLDYAPDAVLADVETLSLVCLDDLQAVAGNDAWEQALFHFFNRARAADCRLLLAADSSPRNLAVRLADLRSRLGWGIVYHLPGYDDEQKASVLAFRAARRGLQLPPEVARYVVSRAPRGLAELLEVLDILDSRSLAEQRALTVPFVKQVLGW